MRLRHLAGSARVSNWNRGRLNENQPKRVCGRSHSDVNIRPLCGSPSEKTNIKEEKFDNTVRLSLVREQIYKWRVIAFTVLAE